MRYLILSDIHSNKEAMAAVLAFVRRKPWDKAVVLGDIVGYGANPNQAVDMVRRLRPLVGVRGNHDKVCSGIEDGELFNRIALEAALWTRKKLTRPNTRWLRTLPQGPVVVDDAFAICHGTPIDEDAYIFGEIEALNVFRQTDYPLCFFGHSHFPVIFALSTDSITTILTAAPSFRFKLREGVRYLVNPGSVGQPRDGSPLTGFAIYDSDSRTVTIHRLNYPVESAQERILRAGLPRPLAERLAVGR
ncbi:MAG TPA: metallophosphoesterase family protein [Vicinamibacteria bacterium]|nr:metallophosphoesterase family protein [Vicinamibacteria bacterium]